MPELRGHHPDHEEIVGQKVKTLRTAHNWSQRELATRMAAAGFLWRQTTVAKTEAADRPIRINELGQLAAIFGVNPSDMLGDDAPQRGRLSEAVSLYALTCAIGATANQLIADFEDLQAAVRLLVNGDGL